MLYEVITLVFILYVLGEGTVDWSEIKNVVMMVIGVFSFIIFIINELTHPNPLMDLRVFKYIPFSVSMVIRITSYNVCYTKLLHSVIFLAFR